VIWQRRKLGARGRSVVLLAMAAGVILACGTGSRPQARVRRLAGTVHAGMPAASPPLLAADEWTALNAGAGARTGAGGSAELEMNLCSGAVRLLPDSALRLGVCGTAETEAESATCTSGGTTYLNLACAEPYLADTYSGRVVVTDATLSMTYVAERRLTLVIVLDGQVTVRPVLDFRNGELDTGLSVGTGQFLYTSPGAESLELVDLPARQPLPVAELPRLVEELEIQEFMDRIRARASEAGLLPATWPAFKQPEQRNTVTILLFGAGGPLEDPAVYGALLEAIKKNAITERMFGQSRVVFLSEVGGATVDVSAIPQDPTSARAELAAAGYPQGFSVTVIYPLLNRVEYFEVGDAIMNDLRNIGLDVALDPYGHAELYAEIQRLIENDEAVIWLERY
jgi:HAMP domain-containing protein